ncbi:MAG: biopolymer transporter ExbD [Bacteroidales bacterium]|nr:biopolymer transporter ExbD [Bacteroidales bacterium]
MAEIIQAEGKQKGGKKKAKKFSTHIDMTPMVDLMCLLITFFMLTTAFSKPKAMEITMPEKDDIEQKTAPKIEAERTINILVSGDDKIYYYFGLADPKLPLPQLISTNYSKDGIRKMLLQRNILVFKAVKELRDKVIRGDEVMADSTLTRKVKELKKTVDPKAPIILIKADEKAKYKNLVDIIDEMAICTVANYAVVDINDLEKAMINGTAVSTPAAK